MRKPCNPRRRKPGESEAQYRKRCGPRPLGQIKMGEKKNPRIPRKKGIASFVKRKRAAQKKGGDPKKGGERRKGQKTIKVKTGA